MGHRELAVLQGKNAEFISTWNKSRLIHDMSSLLLLHCCFPQPSSQEEFCGGHRADGYHIHEQPGEAEAGANERCSASHRHLQESPPEQVC